MMLFKMRVLHISQFNREAFVILILDKLNEEARARVGALVLYQSKGMEQWPQLFLMR